MLRIELKKITCYRIKNRYSNTSHVTKHCMMPKGYSLQEGQCYSKPYNFVDLSHRYKGSDTGIKESRETWTTHNT